MVKRAQFVEALGALPVPDLTPSRDEELAWAAGLFDGDGSTCFERHGTRADYRRADMSVTQTSRIGVPEVLTRFHRIISVGHINGPYGGTERWEPIHRWKAHRLVDVEAVAQAIWPWLGGVKQAQAKAVIERVASQLPLARGNPAWGSHKTHCINGHEYATARIRAYRSRSRDGAERRSSKQCLVCVRVDARRKYAEKKNRRST